MGMWGDTWRGRSYDLGRMNLRELWVAYWTYPAIVVYAALTVASGIGALWLAEGWTGIALAGLLATAIYPVAWYLIHRYILHGRWLYKMKWSAAMWKRVHFDHHQDPHKLEVLFGSLVNTLPTIAGVTLPVGWLIDGVPGALAALSVGLGTTCFYEFCHCIQHLNYRPKSEWLKRIKQLHMAHHFHNEDGNYGIVSFFPDRLFRSYYGEVRQRPRSPHVFNLGYDVEEAKRYPWVQELTGAPPRDRPPGAREPRNADATQAAEAS
ncbi:MAG TPA: sterol desaturase family protein [Azospirillaceae bacterium]|nr:sterol desaturase family protein [Azospirillaceae bacterium]